MFIGITKLPLFDRLREKVPQAWFSHLGGYEVPDQKGLPCELTIVMKHTDGQESGLVFRYGSESQGPPGDVCQFVTDAVAITSIWYEEQKKMIAKANVKSKPWWKFW